MKVSREVGAVEPEPPLPGPRAVGEGGASPGHQAQLAVDAQSMLGCYRTCSAAFRNAGILAWRMKE